MTEDEAKTKWCPMSLSAGKNQYCAGSKCMAWIQTDNEYLPQPGFTTTPGDQLPAGYCGLAGK